MWPQSNGRLAYTPSGTGSHSPPGLRNLPQGHWRMPRQSSTVIPRLNEPPYVPHGSSMSLTQMFRTPTPMSHLLAAGHDAGTSAETSLPDPSSPPPRDSPAGAGATPAISACSF